ncbi:MAG: hypothetical protein KKA44_12965 [Alphaproteobacteria bacterium]|nr:hypothetical protein [Alphaproteobacteria bacterium]MBU0864264.1 hypothetical protein [Alphaproteobacteria bacterium]MBU1825875.1 hypothetical protein [Alphaproteobacteria bacterium]
MTIRRNTAVSAFAAVALLVATHSAHARPAIADPLTRADASFSPYPLNSVTDPKKIGRLVNEKDCTETAIDCEWQDAAGVRHMIFGEVVAVKLINATEVGNRDISALNIGTAGSRPEVMARVRAFLPEIAIDCLEPGQAGEGEGISSCGGSFEPDGWIKLLFGPDNQLTFVRIDAFQGN